MKSTENLNPLGDFSAIQFTAFYLSSIFFGMSIAFIFFSIIKEEPIAFPVIISILFFLVSFTVFISIRHLIKRVY
jgi:hypothetical protein